MSIRNAEKFMEGFWDWGFLDDCFGDSHCSISDVDGQLERNGWFISLETKEVGAIMPRGQRFMYQNLAKTGLFTVVVLYGSKNDPKKVEVIYPKVWGQAGEFNHLVKENIDEAYVKRLVSSWWRKANQRRVKFSGQQF